MQCILQPTYGYWLYNVHTIFYCLRCILKLTYCTLYTDYAVYFTAHILYNICGALYSAHTVQYMRCNLQPTYWTVQCTCSVQYMWCALQPTYVLYSKCGVFFLSELLRSFTESETCCLFWFWSGFVFCILYKYKLVISTISPLWYCVFSVNNFGKHLTPSLPLKRMFLITKRKNMFLSGYSV